MSIDATFAEDLDAGLEAPEFFANSHEYYRKLREVEPVHWNEGLQTWVVTGYAEALTAHKDPRFSSVGRVIKLVDRLPEETRSQLPLLYQHYSATGGNLIHLDRPEHTRIRRIFNRPFSRPEMEKMRPRVHGMVDQLIAEIGDREEIDLIADFAFPLPIAVICDLLSIEIDDVDEFIKWCHDISNIVDPGHTTETALSKQNSLRQYRELVEGYVRERRLNPDGDDFYATLLRVEGEDVVPLTDEEIISSSVTLINGSHETTTNLIGNAMLALQHFPDQEEKLRGDLDGLIEPAVEEFLRFDSPLNHSTRVVTEDLELGGKELKAGQLITVSLVAADRDPAQFPDPDTLDVARADNRHIAFGLGAHFCLGAPLARLEAQIALRSLMERWESFELLEEPPWRANRVQHGLTELKLRVK